ncbi:MAG: two-component regulator propeller domain-containing protein [Acidobacteriaceae bacterium]|nr:two-component regulator propeller domain-containing protein [Acidobacteriaceae bacterium]
MFARGTSVRFGERKAVRRFGVRWRCWVALLLSIGGGLAAQQKRLAPEPRLTVQSWTVGQGLPQNSVLSLCRTRDGFLWVGTLGGLAQFDGARFRVFRALDGNTIQSDAVKFLAEDREGRLWIGSSKAITLYRHGVFTPFEGAPEFLREGISELTADAEGGVWLVNRKGRVVQSDGTKVQSIATSAPVVSLSRAPGGGVWAASRDGFFLLRKDHPVSTVWGKGSGFAAVHASGSGTVLARGEHGTVLLEHGVLHRWPTLHHVWHSAADGDGDSFWITVENGIALVEDGKVLRSMSTKDGLADSDMEALLPDGEGGVWAGAYTAGLQHLYHGLFVSYDQRDGLLEGPYSMVASDPQGAVWIGGTADGAAQASHVLMRVAPGGIERYGVRQGLQTGQPMGMSLDNDGRATFAIAPAGIFQGSKGKFVPLYTSPEGAYPTALLRDHEGNLWFSMHGGVLHEQLEGGGNRLWTERDGLLDTSIWALAEDRMHRLWVASSKGVTLLDATAQRSPQSYPLGFIGSVYPDPFVAQGVWMGSFQGLRYFNGSVFRSLTQRDGLPSDTVISMARDAQGNLWAGSANGIFRLEAEELRRWMSGEAVPFHVRVFGSNDGLLSSQVIDVGQNTLTQTPDHRLWFATTKGISVVRPEQVRNEPLQATVQQVSVDGVRQPAEGDFVIGAGRHTVKMEYTAPELMDAKRVVFAYKLEGWDKGWVNAGGSREVSYAALPPGRYLFRVRASYADAVSAVSTAEVALRLRPYFYQTRWFDLLLCGLAGAAIWFLARVFAGASERRLEAFYQVRLDERNRIARQLHDTLIQEVVGTTLSLEAFSDRISRTDDPDPKERSLGRELSHALESLQGIIRRGRQALVELRDQESVIVDLPAALRQVQHELWRGGGPAFEFASTGVSPTFLVPMYDEVYSIVREALINAFHHSQASSIRLSIACRPFRVEFVVEDNGVGMPSPLRASMRPGHFGLQTMQERAERIGAVLLLEAVEGGGTRIRLIVHRRLWRTPWREERRGRA